MSKVDKNTLNLFMFSMYGEPKTIYREYVQNAYDSIETAAEEGILSTVQDGIVYITIDKGARKIKIEDNGTGVSSQYAEDLRDIGKTNKQRGKQAGFHGIGRLVGAGYCHKLILETSAKGETVKSILTFDVDKVQQMLSDEDIDLSANEVIDQATTLNNFEVEDANEHYFRVTLLGIREEYVQELLNEEIIKNYLLQVAPLSFGTLFKPIIKKSVKDNDIYKSYFDNIGCIKLNINKCYDLKKLYTDEVEGTGTQENDAIDRLRIFEIKGDDGNLLAWGWYAITPFTQKISITPKTELTKGIRLRVKNIQIGNYNYFGGEEYFTQSRNHEYFIGEIHTVHPNIYPTAERSDLTPTNETLLLKRKIKAFFKEELSKVISGANDIKNAIKKVQEADSDLEKLSKQAISPEFTRERKEEKEEEARDKKEENGQRIGNLLSRQENPSTTEGVNFMLDVYRKRIDAANIPVVSPKKSTRNVKNTKDDNLTLKMDELSNRLSRSQISVVRKIFKILNKLYGKKYADLIRSIEYSIIEGLK